VSEMRCFLGIKWNNPEHSEFIQRLTTDQEVGSSNLPGRAIFLSIKTIV